MFTGLVQSMGRLASLAERPGAIRLRIEIGEGAAEARLGDSVAVDGCCLTVVECASDGLFFDVVPETLRRTTLGYRNVGDRVNLELPLRPADRLGGHFVQGHVDAVTTLRERRDRGGEVVFELAVPPELRGHIVEKGSVALDGVSLTVASADAAAGVFTVALIPHTLAATTLGARQAGDRLNVEGDILAKYVASLVGAR